MSERFAVIGAGGGVAPRHLEAIVATGNVVTCAFDPSDSVAVLDRFAPDARFFVDQRRFIDYLATGNAVDWLSVCSPNDTHLEHCRLGLEHGFDVLCEKPTVLDDAGFDSLAQLESATGRRIWTVLQLRTDDRLASLRERLMRDFASRRHEVVLTYVTARGPWYDVSWKSDVERSGGLAINIGVHMFDVLLWLFGPLVDQRVHLRGGRRMAGLMELERARVRWLLSVELDDVPDEKRAVGQRVFRSMQVDGVDVDFAPGLTDLHRRVYERTLVGEGFGIDVARNSIRVANGARFAPVRAGLGDRHPLLA